MDPAPPRPPWSIRAWGWVFLVSSVLILVSFAFGLFWTMASGSRTELSILGGSGLLLSIATGVGFVAGWRPSWFLGVLLGISGLASGLWFLSQVEGNATAAFWTLLILLWLGPSLLLLLCLFLPAGVRWMMGAPATWSTSPPPPPSPAGTPQPRRVLVPVVSTIVFAVVIAVWLLLERS
jgi:hypothetical protein